MLDNQFYDKMLFIPLNYKYPLVLHTRLDDVTRSMPSLPFDSTHEQKTSGVACHHYPWPRYTVKRRRTWHGIIALDSTHGVGRRRAWYNIIDFRQHTWTDNVGLCM